jgi:hypothetical protein
MRQYAIGIAPIVLFCGAAALLLFIYGPSLYVSSADIGWHYALADYIGTNHRLPTSADSYLAAMIHYPPMAHIFAALVGKPLGSPLIGMHVLGVMSVFACYAMFATTITAQKLGVTIISGCVFVAVLLGLRFTMGGILGYEIIANAFYPQLIGTCFYLVSLSLLHLIVQRSWCFFLGSIAAVWISAWIYPLSAVLLAMSAGITTVIIGGLKRDRFGWIAATAVTLPVVIITHPAFAVMVTVANNDGSVVPDVSYLYLFVLTAMLLVTSMLLLWWSQKSRSVADVVLISVSLSCVLAISLQCVAYYLFDLGSVYATKKNLFIASTALSATIAVVVARCLEGRLQQGIEMLHERWQPQQSKVQFGDLFRRMFTIVVAAFSTILVFSGQPSFSSSKFVDFDNDVRLLSRMTEPADLMNNVLSLNDNFNVGMNFATMTSHLKSEFATNVEFFDVLGRGVAPVDTKYAIVSKEQWRQLADRGVTPDCLISTPDLATATLMLARCLPKHKSEEAQSSCTNVWSANEGVTGPGFDAMASDQYGPYRWTTSVVSHISMSDKCTGNGSTVRAVVAFSSNMRTLNSFGIEVNGASVALTRRFVRGGFLFQGEIPPGALRATNGHQLDVAISVSRLDLQPGTDRRLGVALRRVEFLSAGSQPESSLK